MPYSAFLRQFFEITKAFYIVNKISVNKIIV